MTPVPRLPAKTATEPVGVPEWDASVGRIRDLVETIRRQRATFRGLLGEISRELIGLSRRARESGREFDGVSRVLYRMSQDFDTYDIRTTSILQDLGGVDQDYKRIVDNPFTRTAARMSHDLTDAWGRTLVR